MMTCSRPPARPRRGRPPAARRGAALVEAVVAAVVLVVGVLATTGVLAGAMRDRQRARARGDAVAALDARDAHWRATACTAAASGVATTATRLERWQSTRTGPLAAFADTATLTAPRPLSVGVAAVAWCGP